MTTYSGLSDPPLTKQDGLGLGRAEDEDVEGHGAEDGEDDEDGQEDSLLVTLLLWTDEVLEKTSDVQISRSLHDTHRLSGTKSRGGFVKLCVAEFTFDPGGVEGILSTSFLFKRREEN